MAHQRPPSPAGGGVVVRDVGNQRARHRGASSRDQLQTECTTHQPSRAADGTAAVSAVVHLGRRTAPHRRPAGRLGREHTTDVALPDLAYTLARRRAHRPSAHRRHCEQPTGADRGFARGRRRRHSVSGRGRAGRPGTGVGVLRAGFAVGGDGRRAAGDRTGVRRDRRGGRAADRPRVRVLGDRGDDGAARR